MYIIEKANTLSQMNHTYFQLEIQQQIGKIFYNKIKL